MKENNCQYHFCQISFSFNDCKLCILPTLQYHLKAINKTFSLYYYAIWPTPNLAQITLKPNWVLLIFFLYTNGNLWAETTACVRYETLHRQTMYSIIGKERSKISFKTLPILSYWSNGILFCGNIVQHQFGHFFVLHLVSGFE